MSRRRIVGGLAFAVLLLACGHVERDVAPPAPVERGGGDVGAPANVAGAGVGGSAGDVLNVGGAESSAAGRPHTLCENDFVEVSALRNNVQLGFVGTFDDEPTELLASADSVEVASLGILRIGTHLEAASSAFALKGLPYNGSIGVGVAYCKVWGSLFRRAGDSIVSFGLDAGTLVSTIETMDWTTGIATGSLSAEFANEAGTERHVLKGTFTFLVSMPDSRNP